MSTSKQIHKHKLADRYKSDPEFKAQVASNPEGAATDMNTKHPGRIKRAYGWFLEQPVPVVLVLLWLAGAALLGLCAAVLYSYWLLLQAVVVA